MGVARLRDGEPADERATYPVDPFGVLVLPRPRIARARRQHVDLVACTHLFGQQAAGMFGARRHVGPVTRRDEGESHAVLSWGDWCGSQPSVPADAGLRGRIGPLGRALTTPAEGGTVRARRASQPGSGSIACEGGSDVSRSSISRYFRSMTGHE